MVPNIKRRKNESNTQYIKRYTLILYEQLPHTTLEEREKYHDIRDKIVELNYAFFGYVVSQKFLNNTYASYEDKFQACILRFYTCWHWYKFKPKCPRDDISFTVFFKPRLGEMLERDFNEVQYSLRRTLQKEVGDQIDKHWTKVTYDDIADPRVHISPQHKASLMAIYGTLYPANQDDIDPYLEAPEEITQPQGGLESLDDEYNDIVSLLVREMVSKEKKLTNKDLNYMADMYGLDAKSLKSKVPLAEAELYNLIKTHKANLS